MSVKMILAVMWLPALLVVFLVYMLGWMATVQALGFMAVALLVGMAWAGGIEYARKFR